MKKITSTLLVAVMLATMMVAMIPTASAAWDGASVSAALIGSGTEYDPYLITSENDLAFVAKQVNDAVTTYAGEYLKLTVDLDLGGYNWTPIGVSKPNYFCGIFDGDGHTISNLVVKTDVNNSDALYGGVFGRMVDGTIKNLTVDGAKVTSFKYAGAIVGFVSCTADGGFSSVVNCHAKNIEIYGLQIGGVLGRSDTKKAAKTQIVVAGCSSENATFGTATTDDYPSIDNGNHFVGGIVGGAGATTITGCSVKNMVANIYGTTFAPVGGIIGVQGASSQSADVTNCYVIGMNVNASADCHAEKTAIGGLIGKAAHVAVSFGDPNTEYNVFNNFVCDITINNATTSIRNGVVMGWINDSIYFNDVYYVPVSGLESFGEDAYFAEWPFMTINAVSELTAAQLNKGNSTAVWVDDLVAGHPVIDVEAAIANVPSYIDYYVENGGETTEEETTEAPVVSEDPETTEAPVTDAPVETTEAPETESTKAPDTEAPAATNAPETEAPKAEGGCGGMIAGGVAIVALLGTAVVFKKRR